MADLTTDRLEPAAGVTALEQQQASRDPKARGRRRVPPPPPRDEETPESPEDTPHQLDRMA